MSFKSHLISHPISCIYFLFVYMILQPLFYFYLSLIHCVYFQGTDAIRCILLDICKIEKVQLHAETFKKMDNLRMMLFYKPYGVSKESNVILPAFLESLPDDLKFLRWDGFPQKSLPEDFFPDNLVKLYMPHSHLKQLWQRDKVCQALYHIPLHVVLKIKSY